ncbi:MAG: malonyl-CoA decarboxylase [Azovibrio sp.]|uniref:malonyl-CoA decarboxylase n=1 Tax=Azovibrio sp. TaxID=1872673 RepID=UPI003C7380BC
MNSNLMTRGLRKFQDMLGKSRQPKPLDERGLEKLRAQLQECADGLGGEVSARQRALRLGETYQRLDEAGKQAFLRLIATGFGPDPEKVAQAHAEYQQAIGTPAQWEAEARLWSALRSPRTRILTQFNALPQGVRFLVELRVDLLRFLQDDPELASLDRELEFALSSWFDVGFLELRRITWNSPAALLEKLIEYEAVHTIHSWTDLKNRLDSDRRCYGFFHPRMPDEPLIFVEVALTDQLAGDVQQLLDIDAPVFDTRAADTAIFYSISNTQDGLRGVSFGNFLLKRVIDDLQRDLPQLKQFATLSPLPTLRRWAEKHPEAWTQAFLPGDLERLSRLAAIPATVDAVKALLEQPDWAEIPRLSRALQAPLTRLAAQYLLTAKNQERLYDPVARFHLGNGARIERLNFLADTSAKGLSQSYGMMVNYLYEPGAIEENVEALLRQGRIAASSSVRHAARAGSK